MYLGIQDSITRKHFAKWLAASAKDPSAQSIMQTARFLNMDTSLHVFCGNHIPDYAAHEINDKYWAITKALELVNFPLAIPGTKVYRAIQARKVAMYWLELAAHNSKIAMANGVVPQCMLDEWVTLLNDPAYKGRRDFSDNEMAMVLFSFLFASQDAMSSGLIYGFQHLVDHPEVLAKVRKEQELVRQGDYEKPMTLEMLDDMPYLQAVVRESLRVKPPVLMVIIHSIEDEPKVFISTHRFHTLRLSPSRSQKTIRYPQAAWSSRPSSTRCTIPRYSPRPTHSTLIAGLTRIAPRTRTRRITSCLAVDHTAVLVSSTP